MIAILERRMDGDFKTNESKEPTYNNYQTNTLKYKIYFLSSWLFAFLLCVFKSN